MAAVTQTLLHTQTHAPLYADAFTQRCFLAGHFYMQTPLAHRSSYTHTLWHTHTELFTHTHTLNTDMASRRTDMLLHRHRHRHTHRHTHTRTHTLPHIDALTRIARSRFLHRENLSNNIFTHRQSLVHTEVFIHRRLYTHKLWDVRCKISRCKMCRCKMWTCKISAPFLDLEEPYA